MRRTNPIITIGIQARPKMSDKNQPTSGHIRNARPNVAPIRPKYFARSVFGATSLTIAWTIPNQAPLTHETTRDRRNKNTPTSREKAPVILRRRRSAPRPFAKLVAKMRGLRPIRSDNPPIQKATRKVESA